MTPPVVCLDMDRTVIYSPNALNLTLPDVLAPRLLCVELYRKRPMSFMTEQAAADLIALGQLSTVVPTTTRTPAQFARVHLPGPIGKYVIASNGGHLLVDGVSDRAWQQRVATALSGCAPLTEVRRHLRTESSRPEVAACFETLRVASDMFVYAVVDRAELPAGWVQDLTEWSAARGWVTSLQGRKIYVLPQSLTKTAAAAEIMARTGSQTLLAAGDSLLDGDLLRSADLAIRPDHGELAEADLRAEHLCVTKATGVLAGEEILRWMRLRVEELTGEADGRHEVVSAPRYGGAE